MQQSNLTKIFEHSFQENFTMPCLTDYGTGETLTYSDFARRIARIHLLLSEAGVKQGDHIALLGKNNINWVCVFMATITYGAVIVPILSDFNHNDAQHIVNHSDALLLFVSDSIYDSLSFDEMPLVRAVFSIDKPMCLDQRIDGADYASIISRIDARFAEKYPTGFTAINVDYPDIDPDNLALINYTSGTTGFSKGVMLTHRSLRGNVVFGAESKLHFKGSRALSFLPLAHAYGCAFDMLVPLAVGTHVTILGRTPTPAVLMKAFAQVKPSLIICVPLILEKIYKKMILPMLKKPTMRMALAIPFADRAIYPIIRDKLINAFGGEFEEVIVGGAPLNAEVEEFLKRIKFPFTVGYGMTECGPLISYTPWREFLTTSSGHTLNGYMEAKIEGAPGEPGEICVRGTNTMTGYYKKQQITAQTIDKDGWLHTGDMGTLGGDDGKTIFIRGRYKTMILTANGQNIYPEEIEGKLNNMTYVTESLVVERDGKLVALVFPDSEQADNNGISDEEMPEIMEATRRELNTLLAPYEQIAKIQLMPGEFEKTPKRSIKRFLYS
jgi:long-chain acyl-CoA synthetase